MKSMWISLGFAGMMLALAGGSVVTGLRFNASESMPRGIWRAVKFDGVAHHGDAVAVCLDRTPMIERYVGTGSCPSGLEPVLKTIRAVGGDEIEWGPAGAWINGKKVWITLPLEQDSSGRDLEAWPYGIYRVADDEIWLFSSYSEKSFDSRYWGPVKISVVIARGVPVLTWK